MKPRFGSNRNYSYVALDYQLDGSYNIGEFIASGRSGLNERQRQSIIRDVVTHFERSEWLVQGISTPRYFDALEQWISPSGATKKHRIDFDTYLEYRALAAIEDYRRGSIEAQIIEHRVIDAFTSEFAPIPSDICVHTLMPITAKRLGTAGMASLVQLPPGSYECRVRKCKSGGANYDFADADLALVNIADRSKSYELKQSDLLLNCRSGRAVVSTIFCGGLPTHCCGASKPIELRAIDEADEVGSISLDPYEPAMWDQVDTRFIVNLGNRSYWHFVWLSWIYHPEKGIVRNKERYERSRMIASMAAA